MSCRNKKRCFVFPNPQTQDNRQYLPNAGEKIRENTSLNEYPLVDVSYISNTEKPSVGKNIDTVILDLDKELDMLQKSPTDLDCFVSISSRLLCGAVDILWVGEFSLERGRDKAADHVQEFVKKVAKKSGYNKDDIKGAVRYLENQYPIPSDKSTDFFGGGLQHHLRDFAHHPTLGGLFFSLLTQFTEKVYGTDTNGDFQVADIKESAQCLIGQTIKEKIYNGIVIWALHLVSDMAGSSSSVDRGGGTGIPGPILSTLKEISVLPGIKDIKVDEKRLSVYLSKLFNGTLLAEHDGSGKIIKGSELRMDLRGELGGNIEMSRQAFPVMANDCFVSFFYFIRRFKEEYKLRNIHSLTEILSISWADVIPMHNPVLSRMRLISSGVFSGIDIGAAVIQKKGWVAINIPGLKQFYMAISEDVAWGLKVRNTKAVRAMYEKVRESLYAAKHFELSAEEATVFFNIELHKTLYDIEKTEKLEEKDKKQEWLNEWKQMVSDFAEYHINTPAYMFRWYEEDELKQEIATLNPNETWFRMVLFQTLLFEPYFAINTVQAKTGKNKIDKKYKSLESHYKKSGKDNGVQYLDSFGESLLERKGYLSSLFAAYKSNLWCIKFEIHTERALNRFSNLVGNFVSLWLARKITGDSITGSNYLLAAGGSAASELIADHISLFVRSCGITLFKTSKGEKTVLLLDAGRMLEFSIEKDKLFEVSVSKQVRYQVAELVTAVEEILIKDEANYEAALNVITEFSRFCDSVEKPSNIKDEDVIGTPIDIMRKGVKIMQESYEKASGSLTV